MFYFKCWQKGGHENGFKKEKKVQKWSKKNSSVFCCCCLLLLACLLLLCFCASPKVVSRESAAAAAAGNWLAVGKKWCLPFCALALVCHRGFDEKRKDKISEGLDPHRPQARRRRGPHGRVRARDDGNSGAGGVASPLPSRALSQASPPCSPSSIRTTSRRRRVLCGLRSDPSRVLGGLLDEQDVGVALRGALGVWVRQQLLDAQEDVPHRQRRPPPLVLVEDRQADGPRGVDVRVKEPGGEARLGRLRGVVVGRELERQRERAPRPGRAFLSGESAVPFAEVDGAVVFSCVCMFVCCCCFVVVGERGGAGGGRRF